tara:strand:- start:46 stop:1146 length:1101 start_codon:yes stop_codon:yes gene_type:complete
MSKAAELAKAGETLTNQPSGRKNIVTNGAMQVAQRGTSATGLGGDGSTYNTCDRWKISTADSAGRLTMTQTADGPSGFANCIKLDCTTADTSIAAGEYLVLHQNFEGQDLQQIKKGTSDAEIITLSFYVKANAAFTFGVELVDNDNSRQITKLYNTTTGWVRHELTFPADTTGAFDDDVGSSISLYFWLHAGATYTSGTLNTAAWAGQINANRLAGIDSFYSSTDNNFFLTGVQLEIGSQATNFEHRSFGEELALCQRYFYMIGPDAECAVALAFARTTQTAFGIRELPVTMRATPSLAFSDVTQFEIQYLGSVVTTSGMAASGEMSPQIIGFQATVGSAVLTAGQGMYIRDKDGGDATISVSAEL